MFLTLTYATQHLPFSKNSLPTLYKKDLQDFFKRLRKAQFGNEKGDIKYYATGEYGTDNNRPHYHVILFNADQDLIAKAWNRGDFHIGKVTESSVAYTLKYISQPTAIDKKNILDDRQKECSLMSKGLGLSYINDRSIKWHKADVTHRMYINLAGGKKAAMPRYLRDKIYNEPEKWAISRVASIENEIITKTQMEKHGESYFRDRAEAHIAQFRKAEKRDRDHNQKSSTSRTINNRRIR